MPTFDVDVYYTDRTRNPDGSYREYRSRVSVCAVDAADAQCAAIQLAVAIRHDLGVMPLRSAIVL